jgi:hypothetical protein
MPNDNENDDLRIWFQDGLCTHHCSYTQPIGRDRNHDKVLDNPRYVYKGKCNGGFGRFLIPKGETVRELAVLTLPFNDVTIAEELPSPTDAETRLVEGELEVVYLDKVYDSDVNSEQISWEIVPLLRFVSYTLPTGTNWTRAMMVQVGYQGYRGHGASNTPLFVKGNVARGFALVSNAKLLLRDDNGDNHYFDAEAMLTPAKSNDTVDYTLSTTSTLPRSTTNSQCPSAIRSRYSTRIDSARCYNETLPLSFPSEDPSCLDSAESVYQGSSIAGMYPLYPTEAFAAERCAEKAIIMLDPISPLVVAWNQLSPSWVGNPLYGCRKGRVDGRRKYYTVDKNVNIQSSDTIFYGTYNCDEPNMESQANKFCLKHTFEDVNKAYLKGKRTVVNLQQGNLSQYIFEYVAKVRLSNLIQYRAENQIAFISFDYLGTKCVWRVRETLEGYPEQRFAYNPSKHSYDYDGSPDFIDGSGTCLYRSGDTVFSANVCVYKCPRDLECTSADASNVEASFQQCMATCSSHEWNLSENSTSFEYEFTGEIMFFVGETRVKKDVDLIDLQILKDNTDSRFDTTINVTDVDGPSLCLAELKTTQNKQCEANAPPDDTMRIGLKYFAKFTVDEDLDIGNRYYDRFVAEGYCCIHIGDGSAPACNESVKNLNIDNGWRDDFEFSSLQIDQYQGFFAYIDLYKIGTYNQAETKIGPPDVPNIFDADTYFDNENSTYDANFVCLRKLCKLRCNIQIRDTKYDTSGRRRLASTKMRSVVEKRVTFRLGGIEPETAIEQMRQNIYLPFNTSVIQTGEDEKDDGTDITLFVAAGSVAIFAFAAVVVIQKRRRRTPAMFPQSKKLNRVLPASLGSQQYSSGSRWNRGSDLPS